jgi:ferredoxin-NADP reductase
VSGAPVPPVAAVTRAGRGHGTRSGLEAPVDLPDGAAGYPCGSLPFMQTVRSALIDRGIAP